MLVTLGVLVGTSTVGVPVWQVTVPPACIMLARDVWWDWSRHCSMRNERNESSGTAIAGPEAPNCAEGTMAVDDGVVTVGGKNNKANIELQEPRERRPARDNSLNPSLEPAGHTPTSLAEHAHIHLTRLRRTFPTVSAIASRLPVPLLPFAFLTFILVNALSTQGWVALFSGWWGAWVRGTGVLGAVGGMGFLSCIFCNVRALHYSVCCQRGSLTSPPSSGVRHEHRCHDPPRATPPALDCRSAAIAARAVWRGVRACGGLELRRVHADIQRVACGIAVAAHPPAEGHTRPWIGILVGQFANCVCCNAGGVCGTCG